jgi:dihydropteroate synthase
MGIVNVTPDSFSDGGCYFDEKAAVVHGLRLAADGADILDIGGESTRPSSKAVPVDEELRRVLPVIRSLAAETNLPISIDTSKPEVARQSLAAGAAIINDVTALQSAEMAAVVLEWKCGAVLMHMQGEPATMQQNPKYDDVVQDVHAFFRNRIGDLTTAGLQADQLVIDPGIGFGKTFANCSRWGGRFVSACRGRGSLAKSQAVLATNGRPVRLQSCATPSVKIQRKLCGCMTSPQPAMHCSSCRRCILDAGSRAYQLQSLRLQSCAYRSDLEG